MLWYPFSRRRWANLPGPWPQKFLQATFEWYGQLLNFLWLYFDAPTTSEFTLRMEREAALRHIPVSVAVTSYVSAIESKATSLLQHVSVMLALTVVYLSFVESGPIADAILSIEVLLYLWAALACLRCLLQISTIEWMRNEELSNALENAYLIEAMKREVIYRHALQVLVFATLILFAMVVIHSVLRLT